MENQHRQIKGYRDLSQEEIDLMNAIKTKGAELDELIGRVKQHVATQVMASEQHEDKARINQAEPARWVSIARTDFQTGLMALTRAVAQPTFF